MSHHVRWDRSVGGSRKNRNEKKEDQHHHYHYHHHHHHHHHTSILFYIINLCTVDNTRWTGISSAREHRGVSDGERITTKVMRSIQKSDVFILRRRNRSCSTSIRYRSHIYYSRANCHRTRISLLTLRLIRNYRLLVAGCHDQCCLVDW